MSGDRLWVSEPSARYIHCQAFDDLVRPHATMAGPEGMVWCPMVGIGYLPKYDPSRYDRDYWKRYEGYDDTPMGQALSAARIELLARWLRLGNEDDSHIPCDFGIGAGGFLKALWRRRAHAVGYDINPVGLDWLRERRVFVNPWRHTVPVLTAWDALEHVVDAGQLLENVRDWVFVSVPAVPDVPLDPNDIARGSSPPRPDWRHLRPGEHLLYATWRGWIEFFHACGFAAVEMNAVEVDLGRQDIVSFALKRVRPRRPVSAIEAGIRARLGDPWAPT